MPGPTNPNAENAYEGDAVPQNRRRMPVDRRGRTHKFTIQRVDDYTQVDGYITVNTYEDGKPGEIFVAGIAKEGSTTDGFVQWAAMEFSIALQFGAPIDMMCLKMAHMKFDPRGAIVDTDDDWPIDYAHSIPAYIAEYIAYSFGSKELVEKMAKIREELMGQ